MHHKDQPFALSLSKGPRIVSPSNGLSLSKGPRIVSPSNGLSLSKGPRIVSPSNGLCLSKGWDFDKLSPNGVTASS